MNIKYHIKVQDGFVMVTTIVFMVISLSFISVYYTWVGIKNRQLEFRIASARAFYNAEAGIAIVLLAIIFDRITQSYGERMQERVHHMKKKKK